jgi:cell division protein FtsZ
VPELPPLPESSVRIAVVALPDRPVGSERELLSALVDRVGTVVLASGTGAAELTEAVETLVSTVHESGIVNIDLADAQTVFRSADVAALCLGDDPDCDPAAAVRAAFGGLPNGIETDPVRGVLVDVVGAPGMSVGDISDAVSTVRGHVGPDAHVIWGGTVEADREGMGVRLVLAGVKHTRVVPGDRCPRCDAPLSAYTLGDRTTLSCESCGFAGVSVRLRE